MCLQILTYDLGVLKKFFFFNFIYLLFPSLLGSGDLETKAIDVVEQSCAPLPAGLSP